MLIVVMLTANVLSGAIKPIMMISVVCAEYLYDKFQCDFLLQCVKFVSVR